MRGSIFKIKRFSLHDGPGIRTSVFLKGCPLRCAWCHSPEGLDAGNELWHDRSLCIGCGQCVQSCNLHALKLHKDHGNEIIIDGNACNLNGDCVRMCPSGALQFTGKNVTPEEVFKEIQKDSIYYEVSGGGVTLTGGEPFFQPEFSREILMRCRSANIRTAVETCLHTRWESIEELSEYIDLCITDLKIIDPEKHRKYTGLSNETILENFRRLGSSGKDVIVRVPLVKGITDTPDNLDNIKRFVASVNKKIPVEYIKYNDLARNNYERLGIPFMIIE